MQVERTLRKLAEAARRSNRAAEANRLISQADQIKKDPQPSFISYTSEPVRLIDVILPPIYERTPRILDGSVQNQENEPVKRVSLSLEYFDAQGKKLKSGGTITIKDIPPKGIVKLSSIKQPNHPPQGAVAFKVDTMSVTRTGEGTNSELHKQSRELEKSLEKSKNDIKKIASTVYNAEKGAVETLHNCAQSLVVGGKVSEAASKGNCVEAEKLLEPFTTNPDSFPGIGVEYCVIAKCYEDHGNSSDAERCYKAAIKLDTKSITSPLYETDLGSFYGRQGKPKEGEKLIRHALQTAQESDNKIKLRLSDKSLSDELRRMEEQKLASSPVPKILDQLAACLDKEGKTNEADKVYKQYLSIDPNKTTSLEKFADLSNWKYKNPARSISLYKRAIAIRESMFGPESEYTAPDYNYLAYIYTTQDNYSEAETLYKQSLAGFKKIKTPSRITDVETSFAFDGYSKLLESTGRAKEAEEMKIEAKRVAARAH